ncbi:hypothetical protein IE4872_PD01696 (plasmid) [Rhizobium gallicum]|uniref:Uncharacterized protein n=1 Tax=Rhizobium gallicum TaxID=56730 RepID=A0A1L5NWD1_9HYPH|nr:hypothetical protein IE4872_PD01696 [Rhizobium gallicum]
MEDDERGRAIKLFPQEFDRFNPALDEELRHSDGRGEADIAPFRYWRKAVLSQD